MSVESSKYHSSIVNIVEELNEMTSGLEQRTSQTNKDATSLWKEIKELKRKVARRHFRQYGCLLY